MQSTLTPTETDPHDIFVIEPDVVLAARADQTPAAPAVDPISHPVPPQAETTRNVVAAVSVPTVDTTFRATASTATPATGEIRAPEIEVPGDIHLLGKRPPRGRMARAILGFVFAIGAAAATAAWNHYGDTAKTMIANWTPFVLAPSPSQAAAKPAVAEQPSSPDTPGSAQASPTGQASATDQAPTPSAPAAQPVAGTAAAAAAAAPPPSGAPDIAAMSQQIEALKASIEQLKAGQEQLSQQMAQQAAKANAARKLSALAAQPVPAPAHKPRPAFSPAMAAAALASSRPPAPAAPPPQAAYRPMPQPAAAPPPPYQPRAQVVDQADVDTDTVVRPPMPLR